MYSSVISVLAQRAGMKITSRFGSYPSLEFVRNLRRRDMEYQVDPLVHPSSTSPMYSYQPNRTTQHSRGTVLALRQGSVIDIDPVTRYCSSIRTGSPAEVAQPSLPGLVCLLAIQVMTCRDERKSILMRSLVYLSGSTVEAVSTEIHRGGRLNLTDHIALTSRETTSLLPRCDFGGKNPFTARARALQ